jgi:hypothetical protein
MKFHHHYYSHDLQYVNGITIAFGQDTWDLKYESHVKRMEGLIATRNSRLCFEGIGICKRTSLKEPSALLGRYG